MIRLTALASGLICGIGLVLSGMTDPARLHAFLDVTGAWDPTFGIGLLAAMAVAWAGWRATNLLGRPLLGGTVEVPAETRADARLVTGSLLFGLGMGLTGFAPGTALAAAGLLSSDAAIFLVAVLVGMVIADALPRKTADGLPAPRRWSGG